MMINTNRRQNRKGIQRQSRMALVFNHFNAHKIILSRQNKESKTKQNLKLKIDLQQEEIKQMQQ